MKQIIMCMFVVGCSNFLSNTVEASCVYRTDAFGNVVYNCDTGQNGTLRTDAFGNTKDTGTGVTYRTDAFGNTRGTDGSVTRTDAFGNIRINDGTVWRTDAFGNVRSSNGTTCRTNAFGTVTCNQIEVSPDLLNRTSPPVIATGYYTEAGMLLMH